MIDPFITLGVDQDADDQQIRQAYLAGIGRYPADRYPQEFQRIRAAYEKILGHRERLRYRLFDCEPPTPESLCQQLDACCQPGRPSVEQFRAVLAQGRAGSKGTR
jgi:DnaJ-class molecular chaperone